MKKKSKIDLVAAETDFAKQIYKDRAAVNKKAQEVMSAMTAGSRQITIRMDNREIALARQQAEAKGLKYQTYIKMLLHEALAARAA